MDGEEIRGLVKFALFSMDDQRQNQTKKATFLHWDLVFYIQR